MSTSDQPQHVADQSSGGRQLTRKQMREARLTGSTPIVTPEEAESARQAAYSAPVAQTPSVAAPVVPEPVVVPEPQPEEKLTRRQKREQDQARTGSLFIDDATAAPAAPLPAATPFVPAAAAPAPVVPAPVVPAESTPPAAPASSAAMITDVPRPAQQTRRRGWDGDDAASAGFAGEQDGVDDTIRTVQPVASAAVTRAEEETGRAWHAELPATDPVRPAVPTTPAAELAREIPAPATVPPALPVPQPVLPVQPVPQQVIPQTEETPTLEGLLAGVADAAPAPRGTVNAAFGQKVLAEQPQAPKTRSFDALIDDSTGSHHAAPNALIFQQAPTMPSLSGPVASTGEILVTGSYDLAGLGSRGHADGVADGKEVDAVLVDGELAPASSPTPIAASAAIGTIKPAGEVIRPPEPEKGNKLMIVLTITAGVLAVALVGALIVAITTGAFS